MNVALSACETSCAPGATVRTVAHSVRGDAGHQAMNRQRMQVLYAGRVQGVGFRYTARQVARGFEVTGAVRNLPDGRVELVAEGERDELEAFRAALRDSGLDGFIRQETVTWSEPRGGLAGFQIVG